MLSLAVSRTYIFLSSSDSGILHLGDYTTSTQGFVFSTKSYAGQYESYVVDLTTFVDFLPERQYYVLASSSQKFVYFFDGIFQRIFNRLELSFEVSCIHHVEGTNYVGIGSKFSANELYFIPIDSREEFFRESIGGKLILADAFGLKKNLPSSSSRLLSEVSVGPKNMQRR